jgi:hypothetical protein
MVRCLELSRSCTTHKITGPNVRRASILRSDLFVSISANVFSELNFRFAKKSHLFLGFRNQLEMGEFKAVTLSLKSSRESDCQSDG